MAHMSERGGQDHRTREWQSGSQQRPDDGHPSTSSKLSRRDSLSEDNLVRPFSRESISLSSRGSYSVKRRWSGDVSDSRSEQGSCSSICLSRSDSLEGWTCPPLPGQVPVEPTETSHGRTAPGAREASPVTKSSTEKPTECRKRKGFRSFLKRLWKALKRPFCCCFHCSSVDVVEPFVPPSDLEFEIDPEPSSPAPDHSGVKPYNGQDHRRREWQSGSQQRPDDGHPSTSSKLSRRDSLSEDNLVRPFSRESISLSSRGSYSVEWRWSGDVSDSRSEQGSCSSICLSRSDSLEGWTCPPLPGQVPVEPTETSHGRTAPGAREASPVTKSSTESFESFYYVGKMIGSGTFGSVFEGTRKFDGKKVAIKRIRKLDNFLYLDIPGHPEPLITEVALLLMMRREPISPFVIQLYEWFEHPRKFTLVMEYPEPCESLLDFMDRNPQLDETIARVFMRQAVLAAQHCIEHDVFHNDIHADNFLLKHTLEIKLIDFGCGQLFSSDGYESDVYVGKQDHCPPEVFTDPRFHAVPANVWALGVMLYKMVNACRPFRNRREIKHATVTFQSSKLSRECSDLISQCLARDPTKRPTLEQMSQHKWIRNDLD